MKLCSTLRMLRHSVFMLAVFAIGISTAKAQTRTVTGKITASSDGSGIPGVNVQLKGSTKGTSSNAAGSYSIEVSGPNAVLSFSFVGFEPKRSK